jgi:hypothetical protein
MYKFNHGDLSRRQVTLIDSITAVLNCHRLGTGEQLIEPEMVSSVIGQWRVDRDKVNMIKAVRDLSSAEPAIVFSYAAFDTNDELRAHVQECITANQKEVKMSLRDAKQLCDFIVANW